MWSLQQLNTAIFILFSSSFFWIPFYSNDEGTGYLALIIISFPLCFLNCVQVFMFPVIFLWVWQVLIMDKVTIKVMSYSCKMADITDEGISCKLTCIHFKISFFNFIDLGFLVNDFYYFNFGHLRKNELEEYECSSGQPLERWEYTHYRM